MISELWYYEEEEQYPFRTQDYPFPEGSLRRSIYKNQVTDVSRHIQDAVILGISLLNPRKRKDPKGEYKNAVPEMWFEK